MAIKLVCMKLNWTVCVYANVQTHKSLLALIRERQSAREALSENLQPSVLHRLHQPVHRHAPSSYINIFSQNIQKQNSPWFSFHFMKVCCTYPTFFLWAANSCAVAKALSPEGNRSSTMVEPIAFSDMYVRKVNGSNARPMNQAMPAR